MQRKCSICGAPMTKTPGGYKCSGCPNVEPLHSKRHIFTSGTMSQIVFKIFGKNAEEVTQEELDSIQYIELAGTWVNDEVPFSYTAEFRDTLQTVSVKFVDSNGEKFYADIENFKKCKSVAFKELYIRGFIQANEFKYDYL